MKKLLFLFALLSSSFIYAHAPNSSYIFLRIYEKDGIEGRFEINATEINTFFNLNIPKNAKIEDIAPYKDLIQEYIRKNVSFSSELGDYKIVFEELGYLPINYGNFMEFHFRLEEVKTLPDNLNIYYNIGFNEDKSHKGFLTVEYNWKAGMINNEAVIALDFSPSEPNDTLNLSESSVLTGFIAMIKQGVWHIWIGIDHILFLLALILPSVVRRKNDTVFGWEPVLTFKTAFIYIIKVVTFFTIAHTITLTLASLELVTLPSQLVESIIAFSIGLAAYHNIRPIFKMKDWIIAFIFGLFHGFGFASVLSDLGLTGEFLTLSLLGFNLGVEIGQVVIIIGIFPLLYLIRNYKFYPKFLVYTSVLLIIISLYWFIERIFDINLYIDDYIFQFAYNTAKWLGLK
ncbi:HupE/UreJ family protein [Algibacter luteus]|uniref:HupE/UreJ family protein n=1 Tax=Algibacter luteus TaxID=1178825 RepID=UPI002597366B|nr:HupE/UreJ family protein [Algibacter luteus]WJJ95635.1 HupE/UreJ family protein [Algibacter luteus]